MNTINQQITHKIAFLLLTLLLPICLNGQVYKYIGVEDGLSNRRVYRIQKDSKGYMWFLTHDRIDRYNGREFKSYTLMDGEEEISSIMNLNWLCLGDDQTLWEIGKQGRVYRYDDMRDCFQLVYKLPADAVTTGHTPVSYGFIDCNNTVWLCNDAKIYLYHYPSGQVDILQNEIGESITQVEQIDSTHYFIGTDIGIHYAELQQNILKLSPCDKLDQLKVQVNELYYHKPDNKIFIGTFQRGVYVYDLSSHEIRPLNVGLTDVSINRIKALNNKEILIATDGAGIYKVQTDNYTSEPYIVADYHSHNAMNGNTINDIYIDDEQRIWIANYPIGITVRNNRYASYQWIKHSIGNNQSLVNNQVNDIIEDHEGDLWFATNNGVSLYVESQQKWYSFLSASDIWLLNKSHTFMSLCEVSPGIIWIGGYSSGIYEINKRTKKVDYFSPSLIGNLNIRPDKYIRAILRASDGKIWSGGYYNLKEIDCINNKIRYFEDLNGITTILEKDKQYLWIGTATGLYLLDKKAGTHKHIPMPAESYYIYSLFQSEDGALYIGTNNAGLLIYYPQTETFEHYHTDNSSLISNNIYCILSNGEKEIFLSTECGLSCFNLAEKSFQNWTKEQGLLSDHFNADAGTLRKNGHFIFGSTEGAIDFHKKLKLPQNNSYKMILSDLKIYYQTVYPNEEGSPLTTDINNTHSLHLQYNQNLFSLQVSSICYDYPSQILYSWKLDGFYDRWSRPGREGTIYFTNLDPGEYTLRIRLISNENKNIVLEERNMQIIIDQPIWFSIWAILFYIALGLTIGIIILRILIMKKQRKISEEKIQFFINTAHDIRTPLTLIKAPLEEIEEQEEQLSSKGHNSLRTALRNVNALLRLTTNLINFERADTYSGHLYVAEYELGNYLTELVNVFRPYANVKHIQLTYESNFTLQNVWIDKDKMDSILKNLISNALKYTPDGGSVQITALVNDSSWSVEIKDTGIGIPASEQKKLFKMHFRGSNAINSKITGSGIGLILVWKLVHIHKGKLNFSSTEGKGSTIKVTFPKKKKGYKKAITQLHETGERILYSQSGVPLKPLPTFTQQKTISRPAQPASLLIVEDNDELRNYLQSTLSDVYDITVCSNGKTALPLIKEQQPQLIISDIMMPEMRGDELCRILKNNLETSHIPIILLTALNAEKNIIEGLQTGADEYIVKPFNIGILRATIANLLNNRALLKRKYASPDFHDEQHDNSPLNISSELDHKFMASVEENIERHLSDTDFNVDILCGLLNMSRTSFYNKLKALTDQAPADYIRLIRLKRAAQLLREQQYSITEVAELTGFSDAKYFREVFKKHFNVSPSQYAKKNTES